MKILHYALGFPPYRTGGLTKYCMDLMLTQKEQGHDVGMMWPGKIGFVNHKMIIHKSNRLDRISSYELVNPLPVALDEGIDNVDSYMKEGDKDYYKSFLQKLKPDAIHLHTLMGLHKEFLIVAKELKIKTVFTTHDYYGLCPKVTLFCNGHTCDDNNNYINCVECNKVALSIKKIMLMQSSIYRILKNSSVVKELRRKHRKEFFNGTKEETKTLKTRIIEAEIKSNEYRKLRHYYIGLYELIDTIHFNSTITEMVYKRYFEPKDGRVINITHRGIADHRKKKEFTGKLKITYLAPAKPFKGFGILKEALEELWEEGHRDFELNLYSFTNNVRPYMNIQDGYKYEELESIFDKTDLLVAPSIWYETFGFTVLEALSYGVPVLVSENVGAKDLLGNDFGYVIGASKSELKNAIYNILCERDQLLLINSAIISNYNAISSIIGLNNNINSIYI